MSLFDKTPYQRGQIMVVDEIDSQVKNDAVRFSTVAPIGDYSNDPRICLTSVHFPKDDLLNIIWDTLIEPLRETSPDHYYYSKDNLHLTIKNVRLINNPPNFTANDVIRAKAVFEKAIQEHKKIRVYFYRLLLFKSNLALVGTTDEELDKLVLDLDRGLNEAGVSDDKQYMNTANFFCNMTLVRFNTDISSSLKEKIKVLSTRINIKSYEMDSVTLLTSSAVMNNRRIIGKWDLK
jgi:2'-5' RNA ligase